MTNILHPWSLDDKEVSIQLHVNNETGLSSDEAAKRLAAIGANKIESSKRISPLVIFYNQFISPFVLLLIVAAALSFLFKEWLDGIAILFVIILNASLGFWMEFQAERSMEALKRMASVPARVVRDGNLIEIRSENVVPGDIMFIESGDVVTADARLIKSAQLQTNESALTGESLPVEKKCGILPEKAPLAERTNMVYKGTHVSGGNGYATVVQTGMHTELGAIASLVQGAEQASTPLENKIQAFSKKLIWVTAALIVIIFIAGLVNGQKIVLMLETSIALAVAAIPEGLPIVATLALAFGMLKMARHKVIVKKLSSVETLGGTSVICTDKTGTLTQNKIEASFIQVDGLNSRINLNIKDGIDWIDNKAIKTNKTFEELNKIAALCNTATYDIFEGQEKVSGDPLETGLLKMVYCSGTKPQSYKDAYPKIDEIAFSSETKVMATLHETQGYYVAAKGAAEELFSYCTTVMENGEIADFNDSKKNKWLQIAEERAESGLRLLAFAYKTTKNRDKSFLNNLTLAGLIGFIDPPRQEVSKAIEECKTAGIKVVMITGDHPATAKNIAVQLGLASPEDEVLHGRDMKPFNELTAKDKSQWLHTPIFARVSPEQKLDLITLFQDQKMVVGMTGDGVNDAPALKKADIGIAMGERGTQVAQEVANMVLKDDSFSSIVLAIRQGRAIFDNIRKFVIFLLSCNLSELLIIATASILNLHFQLFPLQILFINLITDVLPALALGVTEPAPHIMQRNPLASGEAIVDAKRWKAIFTYSFIIALTTIAAVFASHKMLHGTEGWNTELCNNVLFYTLIFTQVLHVFNMSFQPGLPMYKTEVFGNRYVWLAVISCLVLAMLSYWILPVRNVLQVSMHGWKDWSIIIAFSFLSLFTIQQVKKWGWVL